MAAMGSRLRHTPLARIPLLNRVHGRLAISLHKGDEVDVGPFRVRVDMRDRVIAKKIILYGAYEEREIELLCSLVRPGDRVMDVGANIGIYSLYLSRAVGPAGKVLAVEPDPDNLALLRANLEANHCDNVIVLPFALGTVSGEAGLFQADDNRGNLSFADLGGTGRSVSVPVRRGEEVLEELAFEPRVAKIDVEGAEPQVVSGLGRFKPQVMLFEFVPGHLRALGEDPATFLDSLVSEGYTLRPVEPDGRGGVPGAASSILAAAEEPNANLNIVATR
jgi:FkbM family methyltransferase